MIRPTHIGIVFFAALFLFLFLASNPLREIYLPDPESSEKTVAEIKKLDEAITGNKSEQKTAENTTEITSVVSKITESVADLQKRVATITLAPAPLPTQTPEEINVLARAALVNIYCTTRFSGTTRLVTGSGVMIDSRGIILTNSHVAQNFLFENAPSFGDTDCIIRGGSPASPLYDADILYISPSWVKENAASLKEENPLGTGEGDFALLYVTRSLRKDIPLPNAFPYLQRENDRARIFIGNPVLLASYPAGFLGSATIQKDLYQTSAVAEIKDIFTFGNGSLDVFSIGGTAVAQKGSSGSAVVDLNTGRVLGIIVTSSEGTTTAERDLHAIVFAHMSESMKKDIGLTLPEFLTGDPAVVSASFQQNIAPLLLELLSAR